MEMTRRQFALTLATATLPLPSSNRRTALSWRRCPLKLPTGFSTRVAGLTCNRRNPTKPSPNFKRSLVSAGACR